MTPYMEAAIAKRIADKTVDYDLPLQDFICQCYVNLSPNSYGSHIEEKIKRELDAVYVSASEERGDFMIADKYYEFKVSYLTQKGDSYNITHLRTWQNINRYLFCFVDCDRYFKPNFYVVDKNIINKMKLGFMNGTPQANSNNINVEMRATVKVGEDNHKTIIKHNLLPDTSFDSLREYMIKETNNFAFYLNSGFTR